MLNNEIARIDTDIKVRFPELALKFRQLLLLKSEEFGGND